MAVKSMAYDHPAYTVPFFVGGEIAATASAKTARFCVPTGAIIKSLNCSIITLGGTANAMNLVRQAVTGTALTTMASIASTFGTSSAGALINVLATHASATSLAAGDILWVEKGSADGTGVYATSIEMVLIPGANVTT
jgi:hypothetical protein